VLAGVAAKRLLLVVGVVLVALLVVGLVRGAIGSAILKSEPLIPRPQIHLPPQPVFPASSRELHLGLTSEPSEHGSELDAHPADDHPEEAADEHGESESEGHGEAHATPLAVTEFAITNTMLSAWFATIVIILFFVSRALLSLYLRQSSTSPVRCWDRGWRVKRFP